MKIFHISDVLTVTTGRLVSRNHMGGVYEILNFLTGDNLFTHQLPRAMRECDPWLRTQFPTLFPGVPLMDQFLNGLDRVLVDCANKDAAIIAWVDSVRQAHGLSEMLPVYEMGADMHTHINPIEEALAMFGDDKVIPVGGEE